MSLTRSLSPADLSCFFFSFSPARAHVELSGFVHSSMQRIPRHASRRSHVAPIIIIIEQWCFCIYIYTRRSTPHHTRADDWAWSAKTSYVRATRTIKCDKLPIDENRSWNPDKAMWRRSLLYGDLATDGISFDWCTDGFRWRVSIYDTSCISEKCSVFILGD